MVEDITPRELLGARLIGYSLGEFGISLMNILLGTFIFQFYVYTINLNSILVSIGISLNLIIGALFSVIFGVIIDKKRPGKLGKRRPFLLLGLPTWVVANILLWFPPYAPQFNSIYWPTAIYYWIITIIASISGTLILNVYIAMLPEQSQTHKNREKVSSNRAAFAIIASIIALMLPLIVQSLLEDPEKVKWWQVSGKLILFYMPIIGITFAIFGSIAILITFFSVDESFHNKPSSIKNDNLSITTAFQQMLLPAKDKEFRPFLSISFFNSVSGKTLGILIIPFLAYVLKFRESEFFIYIIVSVSSKFIWFFIWKRIIKKRNLVKLYSLCLIFSIIASFLELLFLIEFKSFELKIILFIIILSTVLGSLYAFPLFSLPLGATLVHNAALKNEEKNINTAISNLSGSYYGLSTFLSSLGQTFASMMLGFILVGPNERNPLIITISLSTMGLFYLFSFLSLKRIKVEIKS